MMKKNKDEEKQKIEKKNKQMAKDAIWIIESYPLSNGPRENVHFPPF